MRNLNAQTSFGNIHALDIGDPSHDVVVFMHGFPGSHMQAVALRERASEKNLRVLAFDRPGYAFSDAFPKPDLKNFVLAVEEFLDQHKVEDFYLIGVSGGNPAALKSAIYFNKRVRALGSICGLAPLSEFSKQYSTLQRAGLHLARYLPQLVLEKLLNIMISKFQAEDNFDRFVDRLDPSDRDVLKSSAIRKILLDSMSTGRKQGSKGIVFDLKTFSGDLDIELSEIQCPYFLWHGKKDKILSYHMSVEISAKVPHSKLKLYENEGHYSLPICQGGEILTELVEGAG